MIISITTQANTTSTFAKSGTIGSLYYNIELAEIEYFIEVNDWLFIIDTNLTKDKALQLEAGLASLTSWTAKDIHQVLNGNYFVVALNKKTAEVHVLRDASGIKTAYYYQTAEAFHVGSIMHDVASLQKKIQFNKESVHQLLYSGYLLNGFSLYKNVHEVKMGQHLVLDSSFTLFEKEKISINLAQKDNDLSPQENFKALRKMTQKAHQPFIGSDNKVLLSGGLDSIAMLIALDDLTKKEDLDSISFRVKDTNEDETVYAQSIANHLQIANTIREVDSNKIDFVEDFENKVLQMNNPYFGLWVFGKFSGHPNQMFYAGQDTRLHTPALNEVDKWAFSLLPHQEKWWLKNLAAPLAKVGQKCMRQLGWNKTNNRVLRNLYKATHIFDLKKYLNKFYLKLDEQKIKDKGLPTDYYQKFAAHFDFDLKDCPSPRALYNQLVQRKWSEQYVYDMRYLQDVARMNNTYIAMPFYQKEMAEFSSSIPFKLSTKAMLGESRFGRKKAIVYKYALRQAFKDKLNKLTFYRAKAVSQTLHQFFNGVLGARIQTLIEQDMQSQDSFVRAFGLEAFVQDFLKTKDWTKNDADYLQTIYYIGMLSLYQKVVCTKKTKVNSKKYHSVCH